MDKHKIKIFGEKFVKNNKNRCKIICNSQECGLRTYLIISDDYTVNDTITIKLTGINNITNMSGMFYKCSSLIFLPNILKWNTENVINMSHMFYFCESLISLPDISKWDTENVINMSHMFEGCNKINCTAKIYIHKCIKFIDRNNNKEITM